MKNKDIYRESEIVALERDLTELAPLLDEVLNSQADGEASPAVIARIHGQADRMLLRRKFERKLRGVTRVAAVASILVLLMYGGMRFAEHKENKRRRVVLNQLRIVSSESGALPPESADSSTEDIAQLLMEMQGLDENTYFAFN